jgi:hypothetical protein
MVDFQLWKAERQTQYFDSKMDLLLFLQGDGFELFGTGFDLYVVVVDNCDCEI